MLVIKEAKPANKTQTVEYGDIIVKGRDYYLVSQISAGRLKLIRLNGDTGNRYTDHDFKRLLTFGDVIEHLNQHTGANWDNAKLIKRDRYSLAIDY